MQDTSQVKMNIKDYKLKHILDSYYDVAMMDRQ
jgi:hypothetical protein